MVESAWRRFDDITGKTVRLDSIGITVLDEADEMLNMGFKEDITKILARTPQDKRTWLFSATMPQEIERIAQKYMVNPCKVTIGSKNSGAKNIEHQYCVVNSRDAYSALKRFIDSDPNLFAILFCRTKREVKMINEKLAKDGYDADALHGDLSQSQRDTVMKKFRSKNLSLLVATDVAARGIDVCDVTHVFHYNLPDDVENYTHRSGRTARAGKSGISMAIVNMGQVRRVKHIERHIGQKIAYIKVPNDLDICKKQLDHFVETLHNVPIDKETIEPYVLSILEKLHTFSKEDLIKRFVLLNFNKFIRTNTDSSYLNADVAARPS